MRVDGAAGGGGVAVFVYGGFDVVDGCGVRVGERFHNNGVDDVCKAGVPAGVNVGVSRHDAVGRRLGAAAAGDGTAATRGNGRRECV